MPPGKSMRRPCLSTGVHAYLHRQEPSLCSFFQIFDPFCECGASRFFTRARANLNQKPLNALKEDSRVQTLLTHRDMVFLYNLLL